MLVCICNQTEGHTCIWHSVHGQFMTNFSEEQLLITPWFMTSRQ